MKPATPSDLTFKIHSGTGGPLVDKIRLVISWTAVSGSNIEYEVQEKALRWGPLPDTWVSLATTSDTKVVLHVEPDKDYRHRVQSRRGDLTSAWVEKSIHTPPMFLGHQADHTVQYLIGTPSPPRSGYDPTGYDPQAAMPTAIAKGIKEWNTSSVASSGPRIQLCTRGPYDCRGRKDDGRTVTLNIRGGDGCGTAACVSQRYSEVADANGHVNNLEIILEEPSRIFTMGKRKKLKPQEWEVPPTVSRYYWTNDKSQHMKEIKLENYPEEPNAHADTEYRHFYAYLPRTVMHEFGHALGLHDLYRSSKGYGGYLMGSDEAAYTEIPRKDLDYLREVYRDHTAHTLD